MDNIDAPDYAFGHGSAAHERPQFVRSVVESVVHVVVEMVEQSNPSRSVSHQVGNVRRFEL
jgi:hypothetical protein